MIVLLCKRRNSRRDELGEHIEQLPIGSGEVKLIGKTAFAVPGALAGVCRIARGRAMVNILDGVTAGS